MSLRSDSDSPKPGSSKLRYASDERNVPRPWCVGAYNEKTPARRPVKIAAENQFLS